MNAISKPLTEIENTNLAIWNRNEKTDPAMTKPFLKGGGFKGTAINATYVVKRLTAEFGPCGKGWGAEPINEEMVTAAPILTDAGTLLGHEIIHKLRILFWWVDPETQQRHSFQQFGATVAVGRNKNGLFSDEDFAKKSLTDALTKAASWLGIAGDIHLGLWDDHRYVDARVKEEQVARATNIIDNGKKPPPAKPPAPDQLQTRVESAVRAFESAQSLARVEQLTEPAEALLAQVMKANRADLRKSLDNAMTAARKRLAEPEVDDDPFADMPGLEEEAA